MCRINMCFCNIDEQLFSSSAYAQNSILKIVLLSYTGVYYRYDPDCVVMFFVSENIEKILYFVNLVSILWKKAVTEKKISKH